MDRLDGSRSSPLLHRQRGAVMVEAAITTTASLLMALGGVAFAVAGDNAISSDAAALYAARTYTQYVSAANADAYETPDVKTKGTVAATGVVHQLMPNIGTLQIQDIYIPNAGMGTVKDTTYFNKTQRHGGVSIVVPQARQASIQPSFQNWFSAPGLLGLQGVDIEPDEQIVDPEFNIAGDSTFAANPNSKLPLSGASKYFGTGLDQAPYYFSFNYIWTCESSSSWSTACSGGSAGYRAFGVAEYLDASNWSATNLSIKSGANNVFSAMICHQRVFSYIAESFFPAATRPLYTGKSDDVYNETSSMSDATWMEQPFKYVHTWDAVLGANQKVATSSTVGTQPLNPLNGCDAVTVSYG